MKRLFAWEEAQWKEWCSLLDNVVLQENISNKWVWENDPKKITWSKDLSVIKS